MCKKLFIFVFVIYVSLVYSESASFITKCKWDDAKCIKESAQATIPKFAEGMPQFNVEMMDPLKIKHVDASSPNLQLTVTDITVTGLKNCVAKKVSRDKPKLKLFVKFECTVDFNGKYDMKGQLFLLPIEGNGDLIATVRKIVIDVDIDIAEIQKEGKTHWTVKSWKYSFDLKDKSDVQFTNLFPNSEFLRKSTNDLIASSGNDVVKEIGPPIIKAVVGKVIKNTKNFFAVVPVSELTMDEGI